MVLGILIDGFKELMADANEDEGQQDGESNCMERPAPPWLEHCVLFLEVAQILWQHGLRHRSASKEVQALMPGVERAKVSIPLILSR